MLSGSNGSLLGGAFCFMTQPSRSSVWFTKALADWTGARITGAHSFASIRSETSTTVCHRQTPGWNAERASPFPPLVTRTAERRAACCGAHQKLMANEMVSMV